MTAVFVVRHPQTTWNQAQRYQGRLDTPLSEEGREQASLLARSFQGEHLDTVYTSPLSRARDLAGVVARAAGAPLRVDARLTEIAMGPWEGLQLDDIRRRYPDLYREWYTRPDLVHFPGGEGVHDVCARSLGVMRDVFARHPSGMVAVVTHSVVVQSIVATALHMHLRFLHSIRISNAGVTTMCGDAAPGVLLTLNSLEPLFGSPVRSALAETCPDAKPRRLTT
jgi:broad specificity phosphatase PhoE